MPQDNRNYRAGWGSIGAPGQRSKEAVWRKVQALGLPHEVAVAVAKNIWECELDFRRGILRDPFLAPPYPSVHRDPPPPVDYQPQPKNNQTQLL